MFYSKQTDSEVSAREDRSIRVLENKSKEVRTNPIQGQTLNYQSTQIKNKK